jgi:hypothetical protein
MYIPPAGIYQTPEEVSIQPVLDKIYSTIRQATQNSSRQTDIILTGDFNRHHPAWSNNQVHHGLIGHAEELLHFFQTLRLQWCLLRGTLTFWSLKDPGKTSTLDLTVTNSLEQLIKCHLYHDHYGSGHRGTYSEWSLHPERKPECKPRRNYERAKWDQIGRTIQDLLVPWPTIASERELDTTVERLILTTNSAINQFTPLAQPSSYSKQWFTPELKEQQREVNRARRR